MPTLLPSKQMPLWRGIKILIAAKEIRLWLRISVWKHNVRTWTARRILRAARRKAAVAHRRIDIALKIAPWLEKRRDATVD
jgi:hypothetical protein